MYQSCIRFAKSTFSAFPAGIVSLRRWLSHTSYFNESLATHAPGQQFLPTESKRRCSPYQSHGLTVMECLIAIAIVGALAALLLPAVQFARESSRRLACSVKLRQVGTAIACYCELYGQFPAPRLMDGWMVAANERSALAPLLPFLERSDIFDMINYEVRPNADRVNWPSIANSTARLLRIAAFICPSEPGNAEFRNSIRLNAGLSPQNPGPFFALRGARPADIRQGLANVAFSSERIGGSFAPRSPNPRVDVVYRRRPTDVMETLANIDRICADQPDQVWHVVSGRYWFYWGTLFTAYYHAAPPNDTRSSCSISLDSSGGEGLHGPRSYHPAGVNVLFGAGNVSFVVDSIDVPVWHRLGTLKGDFDERF